jgi:hypothetical protein
VHFGRFKVVYFLEVSGMNSINWHILPDHDHINNMDEALVSQGTISMDQMKVADQLQQLKDVTKLKAEYKIERNARL